MKLSIVVICTWASAQSFLHDVDFNVGKRYDRDIEEFDELRIYQHHKKIFPSYKFCCGGRKSFDRIVRKELRNIKQSCFNKVASSKNYTNFVLGIVLTGGEPALAHYPPLGGKFVTDPFSCENIIELKNIFYCGTDCIFNEVGLLDTGGAVMSENVKEFYSKAITNDWHKIITEKAVDKCIALKDNDQEVKGENLKCAPTAANFNYCVDQEVIKTCPEEQFKQDEFCTAVKKGFEEKDAQDKNR